MKPETKSPRNVVIADKSALYYMLHTDAGYRIAGSGVLGNPLDGAHLDGKLLETLDLSHPQLGGLPVSLLMSDKDERSQSGKFNCSYCGYQLKDGSFFELRPGLLMTSPELAFVRYACKDNEYRLLQLGMDLCARYYLHWQTGEIEDRTAFLTTPERIAAYVSESPGIRGGKRARKVLKWLMPNSASPEETRSYIQYCLPLHMGGFAIPIDCLNFDVRAGQLAGIFEQSEFCIDAVNIDRRIGFEYDGDDAHQEPWKDKRRRNELGALGWRIFPFGKQVLYSPHAALQFGKQLRKVFGLRDRWPQNWHDKYLQLREGIGLPTR